MSSAEDESPFGTLPRSIVGKILWSIGWEPDIHLKTARLVCRRWKWILDFPYDEDGTIIGDDSLNEVLKIRGLRLERIQIEVVSKTEWPPAASIEQFSVLKETYIDMSNSGPTVMTVLQCGTETVETLRFSEFSMQNVNAKEIGPIVSRIRWTNLTELILQTQVLGFDALPHSNEEKTHGIANSENDAGTSIRIDANAENDASTSGSDANTQNDATGGEDLIPGEDTSVPVSSETDAHHHAIAIEQFLRVANMPKLKKFTIGIEQYWGEIVGPMTSTTMSEFTGFVQRHASTLKKLSLQISLHGVKIAGFSLTGPLFSLERQDSIAHALKLETLEISCRNSDFMKEFVPPFVWRVETVKTLTLVQYSHNHAPRPGIQSPFQELIQRCRLNLVEVNFSFSSVDADPNLFRIQWLGECLALRKLSMYGHFEDLNPHVRLPQVTTFEIEHATMEIPGDVSAWISQAIQNVDNLLIYELSRADMENCQWLAKLLPLVKLRRIQYDWETDDDDDEEYVDYSGPARLFCEQNSVRLVHEPDPVHRTIRVLHPAEVQTQIE